MKRLIILVVALSLFLDFFSGCRSRMIKDSTLEKASSLSAAEGALVEEFLEEIIVGFDSLEDKRPNEDIAYMTSVREKVSDNILSALKETQIFDIMHTPATLDDPVIVTGEIRKFDWESYDTMISYIPGLNVLPFLGLPSNTVDSEVEIYLAIKNNATKEVILELDEFYSKRRKYNMYSFKQEKVEVELAGCFEIVLRRLKDRLIAKKTKILDAYYTIAQEAAKSRAVAQEEKAEAKVEVTPPAEVEEAPAVAPELAPEVKVEGVAQDQTVETAKDVILDQPKVEQEAIVPAPEAPAVEAVVKTEEVPITQEQPQTEEAVKTEGQSPSEVIDAQQEQVPVQKTGE
jgi:hypothetical protein